MVKHFTKEDGNAQSIQTLRGDEICTCIKIAILNVHQIQKIFVYFNVTQIVILKMEKNITKLSCEFSTRVLS